MLPILHIGPLAIQTPGLILMLGLWFGLLLSEKIARIEQKVDPNSIYNLALVALIAGLVGARLFYAALSPDIFIKEPLNLLSLNTAMLDVSGGLITSGIASLVYAQKHKLSLWPTLDTFTPFFCVMAIAIGLAHFASGDAFGAPARLPWSIYLWGEYRHPTQLYETLLALVVAILVWPRQRNSMITGLRFLTFVILTASGRILLETFRGDSTLIFGSLRAAQVAAWGALAFGLSLIGTRLKQAQAMTIKEEST
ncbi:MAG TPA: prolipoprotein diacylglyceryl transferase family protein [Longilinea sp.]|nr:prolipoprotein diacylglyceryl transferase family protein [Longilinea sp.]